MANGTANTKELYEALNEFKDKTNSDVTEIKESLATIIANQKARIEVDTEVKNDLKEQAKTIQDLENRVTKNTTICGIGLMVAIPLIVALIKADIV